MEKIINETDIGKLKAQSRILIMKIRKKYESSNPYFLLSVSTWYMEIMLEILTTIELIDMMEYIVYKIERRDKNENSKCGYKRR